MKGTAIVHFVISVAGNQSPTVTHLGSGSGSEVSLESESSDTEELSNVEVDIPARTFRIEKQVRFLAFTKSS